MDSLLAFSFIFVEIEKLLEIVRKAQTKEPEAFCKVLRFN